MTRAPGIFLGALAAVFAPVLVAQGNDPDRAVAGGGTLPPGWHAHTERNAPMTNVKFAAMGDGFHVTLGPATIFWRDADNATGSYHAVATFTQTKAPEHPEAYGMLIGGKNLADSTQSYTYFLLRTVKDKSEFSIRRRAGYAARPTAVVDWTANAAIKPIDEQGRATNELSVLVKDGKVSFMVNGTEVHNAAASDVDANGIVGFRINHNLDLHLSALGVHKM